MTPMDIALEEARAAAQRGEVPVGAVVTDASGAVLARADLRRARLFRADLTGANFTGAELTGTDFTNAILDGARWTDGVRICGAGSLGACR